MTPHLLELSRAGQSTWLDYLHRRILENGQLKRWIEEDGPRGMTSNPDGVRLFAEAFDDLLAAVDAKRARIRTTGRTNGL